jgi:AraC-like DNA-binding protein
MVPIHQFLHKRRKGLGGFAKLLCLYLYELLRNSRCILFTSSDFGRPNEPEGFARSIALGNTWMLNRVLMRLYILAPKFHDPHFKSFFTLTDNIVKEPSRDRTAEHMATSLHLSQSTLLRFFKKHFELSPKEFIIQARMSFASELLINSDESLKRISNNVGYVNVHTFSRIFTNYFGLPPGKYRNLKNKGLDNKS